MFKKVFVLFLVMALVVSSLVGCGNKTDTGAASQEQKQEATEKTQDESKTPAKDNKDIVIAVADTFISMDPHDTNDTLSYSAQKTMMQGLVGFDKEMNVIPVLAESYEANEDATEFTFKLRKGIKFHDGTDFNAQAVKVNIDRLANPENKLKRHSLFAIVDHTEVIDDYTVKVVLKEPFGAMINTFAHPAAMMHSPKALEEFGKEVSRNPVGTGPFVFKEWISGTYLKVVKNENYWKPDYPKVDSITFKPVKENGSRIAMLQTKEADFIYPVPAEQIEAINGKDGVIVETKPSIIVRYLAMNCNKKPFNDVRVRKAINYAINKEAFAKVVYGGYMEKMDSIIAPNTQFYSKQENTYDFNLEKAKELMKEAGYENGFETEIWSNNSSGTIKGMEFLQQQLAQIGIKANLVPMESGTRLERIWTVENPEDAELQMYYGGWSPSTGDADWGIRPLFAGESFPPNSYNTAYYNNEEANKWIKKGIATADNEERREAYEKVQEIIWNDAPWAFLGVNLTMGGRQEYLEGVYLLPDGSLSVEDAEIK
ncbi:glutathione ABC transporter substrate-binding protein [Paramaledivibacter caminithermalis]|uniref:Glutathione-binding protein GsiB n=1 Tax=Paramaledivibacter caminithermalis (strain DSM 15212 / CIP 107654 / DViRD3) TaxID=1121301 RepID=A0A1M6KQL7_PARC5|nr:glutathione ABC transporter substrate-binding protein [Paramaledivibacter caminithermalis]SHJ61225.1 glutathione transport system substrate-binding protein [Paramaledivibacter caminithermalis DSM 15212]